MLKNNVAPASVNAYFLLRGKGIDLNQKGKIIEFMINHGKTFTRAELSENIGIRINAICGRVHELIKNGYIHELPKRVCTVTGVEASPLTLTSKYRSAF